MNRNPKQDKTKEAFYLKRHVKSTKNQPGIKRTWRKLYRQIKLINSSTRLKTAVFH